MMGPLSLTSCRSPFPGRVRIEARDALSGTHAARGIDAYPGDVALAVRIAYGELLPLVWLIKANRERLGLQ